jgi:class 3 adenylate cyclase
LRFRNPDYRRFHAIRVQNLTARNHLEVGHERQRMPAPLSGTVTFLFTDIEGSTRLWEEHPQAMSQALARHDTILVGAVESSGGQVVKTTGDGLFAVFGRAESALAAALAAQRALVGAAWDPTCELRVRMGLHAGYAEFRDGDYHGSAVNRAARLTSAGHGAQVLVSGATASLVAGQLMALTALSTIGWNWLGNGKYP